MAFFSKLRLYSVHFKPAHGRQNEDLIFIAEGFSFWAFVLSPFWMLYHRLWKLTALFIALNISAVLLTQTLGLDEISVGIAQMGVQIWVGFAAHDYWREALTRRGYIQLSMVSGENEMRAQQRFLDRHAASLATI